METPIYRLCIHHMFSSLNQKQIHKLGFGVEPTGSTTFTPSTYPIGMSEKTTKQQQYSRNAGVRMYEW